MAAPILSLVLCSRNDEYMGNSRWRLETTLNYIGARAAALELPEAIEIVVADWGSETPLRDVLALDPAAARITSFITVPRDVVDRANKDSPFAEVIALNVAARRARGAYIGRIDQDTLVGARFLRQFIAWAQDGASPAGASLHGTLWFSCHRGIPYRFAARCPSFAAVTRLVQWFGRWLVVEDHPTFFHAGVGIVLMHRDLWDVSGGYDERMIYMNDMEIDMATRLMTRYPVVDLGRLVQYDFYHLEHYHPGGTRSSSAHRRVNSQVGREDRGIRPSGDGWGLAACSLEAVQASARPSARPRLSSAAFLGLALWTTAQTGIDRLWYKAIPQFRHRWSRRFLAAGRVLAGEPVTQWPGRLWKLWIERPSAKAGS